MLRGLKNCRERAPRLNSTYVLRHRCISFLHGFISFGELAAGVFTLARFFVVSTMFSMTKTLSPHRRGRSSNQ